MWFSMRAPFGGITLLAAAWGVACTGEIETRAGSTPYPAVSGPGPTGPGPTGPGPTEPGPTEPGVRYAYTCTGEQKLLRGLTFDRPRRLSRRELTNTLGALLGESLAVDPTISTKLQGLPDDDIEVADEFVEATPVALAEVLSTIAKRAADLAIGSTAWRGQFLGACAVEAVLAEACVEQAVKSFGSRVWRRDLTAAEVAGYVGFFRDMGGGAEGLSFLLRRLLQSPSLVFHLEDGTATASGGRIRLTDFEVASRISYLAASTMPDAPLMEAARKGELRQIDNVRGHLQRLMEERQARDKLRDFFRYYTRLGIVADPFEPPAKAAGVIAKGQGAEMRRELIDFMDHAFSSNANTFATLMTSDAAFPVSKSLALVFGVDPIGTAQPVAHAPSHRGLLHRPALLASAGARTSPIVRGAHVRKLFLCDELGMPDPAAVQKRQDQVGDIENMSNRARVTQLTSDAACFGCHRLVNPIGFSFEGFDQMGRRRSEEPIFDSSGNVTRTWPIDTRVDEPMIEGDGPQAIADSNQLADVLAGSPKARACFSRRLFEYYRQRPTDEDKDGCALNEIEVEGRKGSLQSMVIAAMANEDIFWRRQP
jgi:Protein of unknown function (DUF1592)/Protein of unknown function (DUF1588)/Protein of unknown function (DUF1595)